MKIKYFVALAFLLVVPAVGFAGTAYYVNPQAPNGGNGSFEKPWNSLAQINNFKFKNGDDLYFKAGTTLNMTGRLFVNWHGSAGDRVVIGAYYGKNLFGINGGSRPVLNGNKNQPADLDFALVHYAGPGYVTIQDLHIKNSRAIGITVAEVYNVDKRRSTHNELKNNIVTDSGRQGIVLSRSSYSLIENNLVDGTSQTPTYTAASPTVPRYAGAGMEITGMGVEATTQYNTVRGNTIRRCNESLGIYQGAQYTTVENNTIYDIAGVGIYAANSRNGVIRNNLVYGIDPKQSKNHLQPDRGRGPLIWIDVEGHLANTVKVTGGWEICNNYLAGGMTGIWLQCNSNHLGVFQKGNKIYNNIIVDCDRNFWLHQAVNGWSGNEIYNNFSFIFSPGMVHVQGMTSPPGVTWRKNYFNSKVGGNAGADLNQSSVSLNRTNGWRNLPYGTVSPAFFTGVGFNNVVPITPLSPITTLRVVQ